MKWPKTHFLFAFVLKHFAIRQNDRFIFFVISLTIAVVTLFASIERQNELTLLRMEIPTLSKEIQVLQEENIRLRYELDQFESPVHLMEFARKPEFSHLKFPYVKDIIILSKTQHPNHDE